MRLAALDSAAGVPAGPLLLAEVDGELRAALSLSDGHVDRRPVLTDGSTWSSCCACMRRPAPAAQRARRRRCAARPARSGHG